MISSTFCQKRCSSLFRNRQRRFAKAPRCALCVANLLEASRSRGCSPTFGRWTHRSATKRLEPCRGLQFRNLSVVSTMLSVLPEEVVEEADLEISESKIEFSRRFWEVGFVKDKVESANSLAAELAQAAAELGSIKKELRNTKRPTYSRRASPGSRAGAKSPYKVFPIPKKLTFEAVEAVTEDEMKSMKAQGERRKKSITQSRSKAKIRAPMQTHNERGRYGVWDARVVQLLEKMGGPLLSAAEECKYGRIVQKCMRIKAREEQLKEKLGHEPSVEEIAKDMRMSTSSYKRAKMAGVEARKIMQQRNIRLVVSVARRYRLQSSDIADLVSDGMVGLDRAIDKFDPSKGFRFSTYAHWWIRQAVMRGQTEESRVVRVPPHVLELVARIKRTKEYLEAKGKSSDENAISEETGLSVKRIKKLRTVLKKTVHLDSPVYSGDGGSCLRHEVVEDPKAGSPDTSSVMRSLQADLENVLDTLYPRERNILRLRYGLDDGKVRTLVEIGEFLNITRERVRQIEVKAVRKLRNPERYGSLLDYKKVTNSSIPEDILLSLKKASHEA